MDDSPLENVKVRSAEPGNMVLGLVLVLGHAVKHVFNAGFFIVLPELQLQFGLSNAAIGTLATIRNAGGGLANIPAGYIADRYSDRWPAILAISIAMVGVFHFLMGITSTYWLLVLTATLAGISISFWHPPAIAALSKRFATRRGFAISMHGSGGSIGEALGPITVGLLLSLFFWNTVVQSGIIPALAIAITVWILLRGLRGSPGNPVSFRMYVHTVVRQIRYPALATILFITGGYSAVQGILITFLPLYLRVELGYSPLVMSAFISGSQTMGIVSQPLLGLLSDRYSRKSVLLPGLLGLGITVTVLPFAGTGLPLFLVLVMMGAFSYPLMAVLLAAAMDIAGSDVQATTVSLVFGAAILFSAVSPAIAGHLADTYNVRAVFFLASGIIFAVFVFAAARMRR
jgi:MFS family permease